MLKLQICGMATGQIIYLSLPILNDLAKTQSCTKEPLLAALLIFTGMEFVVTRLVIEGRVIIWHEENHL